jgi:hypothetical protein
LFDQVRLNYPRFVSGQPANVFVVPIQGEYHHKLFPEIALHEPLPLFPGQVSLQTGDPRRPGNTIRKVYLCRASIRTMKAGDVLLFYESHAKSFSASQTITSVGVLEAVTVTADFEELTKLTAKRSVFSEKELREMLGEKSTPIKVLDFLLMGHLERSLPLRELIELGALKAAPQSIGRLGVEAWSVLKPKMQLGFDF